MHQSIFEYENYRSFLQDKLSGKIHNSRKMSIRGFARKAGISSPGYIQYVLNGKRNLSHAAIQKFGRGLSLNKEESEFFENLVLFNQSKTSDDKKIYWERMSRSRSYRQLRSVDQKQYEFYSLWYCTAIREMVNFVNFKEDHHWISQQLDPAIRVKESQKALAILLELGFLRRNAQGNLEQVDASITTGAEVKSLAIVNFHKQMMELAKDSVENKKSTQRDIGSITIGISQNQFEDLRNTVRDFRKELIKKFGHNTNVDRVYQVNFQLFPLTKNP